MPESLSAFAPILCVDQGLLDGDAIFTREATTLFVDLAGFTPLTDRLGKFGSRGTEELSHFIRGFFGQVTVDALDLGGDPIAFGGDALTIVFDGEPGATLKAARTLASSIQQLAARTAGTPTLAGPIAIETRIGIARGTVTTTVAQSAERSVVMQLGTGLDRAVAAESAAANGHVVMHQSTDPPWQATGDFASVAKNKRGVDLGAPTPDELARLVHPVLAGRLSAGNALLESHRSVTVAFVSFAARQSNQIAAFRHSTGHLLQSVVDCGGEVVQVSGGDKGVVALAVFGAPIGHDDDPLRAVQVMLELRRREPSIKVGITTGPVFATLLGSSRRRFHAHFGQTLNMAARLMQAAEERQILVDAPTWKATAAYCRRRGAPTLREVKGRAAPVEVHEVSGWRRRRRLNPPTAAAPLVGREREIAEVEHLLDELQGGRGCLMSVTGDPGIGKSRLAREAIERAAIRGAQVLMVDADDYPYGQVRGLWRELLGARLAIPVSAGPAAWITALRDRMPEQMGQFVALGSLLGMRLGRQKDSARPSPDIESELAYHLASKIIIGRPQQEPLLIVVENVHHLDQGSQDLLSLVGRQLTNVPVSVLTTGRTQPVPLGDPLHHVGRQLRLPELTEAASSTFVEDTWRQSGGGSPPPWLSEAVLTRAGGNPLFLRAVTQQVRQSWQPGDPPPAEDARGDSLAHLLSERVDALESTQRQLLEVLAVARRPCHLTTVAAVSPEQRGERAIVAAANHIESAGFVRVTFDSRGALYHVKHSVLQQVIYEQMSHDERDRIHRALAAHLETTDVDPREIAEHVRHSGDSPMARKWFPLAAASARESWNIAEAVEWWRIALPLLTGQSHDRAHVELMEVLLVGGHANEALELANEAVRPTDRDGGEELVDDLPTSLTIRNRLATAEAALVCGDFERCERESSLVMRLADEHDEARQQRAAELLVNSLSERGLMDVAVKIAEQQVERAYACDDAQCITTASASLGAALLWSGQPELASKHYEVARAGAASIGDAIHETHVLSDLAGCAFATGNFPACLTFLADARLVADRIGYRRHLMVNLSNEAGLRSTLGDAWAANCASLAFMKSLEMGDLTTAARCTANWMGSDSTLMSNAELWRRQARVDSGLSRGLEAAQSNAFAAIAAAQSGDLENAEAAAQLAAGHPSATERGPLKRQVELAQLMVRAKRLKPNQTKDRTEVLRTLLELRDAEGATEVERAEFSLERWRVGQDAESRALAISDLRAAFAVEPSSVVRSWFHEIDAELPTLPDPLPPPVGIGDTSTSHIQLDDALSQLELLVGLQPMR